jgi:hypothetical protein
MGRLGFVSLIAGRTASAVATVAVLVLGLGTLPAAEASTLWTIAHSPNAVTPNGNLAAVSCVLATSCWAVGNDTSAGGAGQVLAESWNGSLWKTQATPKPPKSIGAGLDAVSCSSAGACEAVGSYRTTTGTVPLAEAWNGTAWSVQAVPNPSGTVSATLTGVSCTAAGVCTAVGYYTVTGEPTQTLAEAWNGTTWTIQTTPNPAGVTTVQLNGVSCTATGCTAVGYYETTNFFFDTLAEAWNGTTWTIQTTPNPAGSDYADLSGVSCTDSTCTAVGNYDTPSDVDSTLAEAWNGSTWTIQTTPNPSTAAATVLTGVSCPSASACTGSGYYDTSSGDTLTLAEAWNGTTWTIQTTPNPSGPPLSELNGVSCTGGDCVAAGYSQTDQQSTTPVDTTLAQTWNGTAWSSQAAVSPSGAVPSYLTSISCVSATSCTAVGYHFSVATSEYVPLAERWNGTAWSVKSVPTPSGSTGTYLESVSCTSASACQAVGFENTSGPGVTFAVSWNGTAWSIKTTPNPAGAAASLLYGVSCTSASACTAVGRSGSGGDSETLAETWNGSAWSIQATPNPAGTTFSTLSSVSCASGSRCEAVGSYNHNNVNKTMAEGWNGAAWTVQTTPNPAGAEANYLASVSCPTAGYCMAAGDYENSSAVNKALSEQWDGTAWKVKTAVTPVHSYATQFDGVSCTGPAACTATGYYLSSTAGAKTLAQVWNGTTWKTQSTATPAGATTASLQGVSCLSGGCTAAGNFKNTAAEATLIENGPTP